MDGFTGYESATIEHLLDANGGDRPVPRRPLVGNALDRCRSRVQQDTHGHRRRIWDPLYSARQVLHTGADILTPRQHQRLTVSFAAHDCAEIEVTWGIGQRTVTANRDPAPHSRATMTVLIESLRSGVSLVLTELMTRDRTPTKRAAGDLAYSDHPRTSDGLTKTINGRLERLSSTVLGFRNLTHYIARSSSRPAASHSS